MNYWHKRTENWLKYLSELLSTSLTLGQALLLIVSVILLSGCCPDPIVIRQACDPYPPLPESLRNYQSKNLDLVPVEMLPSQSKNAGSDSKQQ